MDIEEKMRMFARDFRVGNFAIQGELIGEGIQGNKYKLSGQTVNFFNAFDIGNFKYVDFGNFERALNKMGLPIVPVISPIYVLGNDINELIRQATFRSTLNESVWAEGIVIRPRMERLDLLLSNEKFNNGRVSFKVINPEFLIKYGE